MINFTRSSPINRSDREFRNGIGSKVIWFTGLSGSGKSTLANALEVALYNNGLCTYILDGDDLRKGINRDLGFSEIDRAENLRRSAEVAKLFLDAGVIVIAAFISPFERDRQTVRHIVGADDFVEVFVSTPVEVCEARDVKGLYRRARAGEIPNLTGVGSPYEVPSAPDLIVNTDLEPLSKTIERLLKLAFSLDLTVERRPKFMSI